MTKNQEAKSSVKNESLYAWYPHQSEPPRSDPKEIYSKLGSRPPRDKSIIGNNPLNICIFRFL